MRRAAMFFVTVELIPALLIFATTFITTVSLPESCWAQPRARSLLSSAAGKKADERRRQLSGRTLNDAEVSAFDLRPDTVDDILWSSSNNDTEFFGDFRGLSYLNYVNSAVGFGRSDDVEHSSFAQRLLVYQAVKTVGEQIQKSALDTYYRQALGGLKRVRRNTTMQVVHEKGGELGFEKGEKEKPLLEIKLHASMRNGVEPRLRIGKFLTLRFDPLNQDSLLEFKTDF